MTIQNVISKAIDGGWNSVDTHYLKLHQSKITENDIAFRNALLDHLFWKALGKSMGWGVTKSVDTQCTKCNLTEFDNGDGPWDGDIILGGKGGGENGAFVHRIYKSGKVSEKDCGGLIQKTYPDMSNWKKHWHILIDHLADGGTIESYFEQL